MKNNENPLTNRLAWRGDAEAGRDQAARRLLADPRRLTRMQPLLERAAGEAELTWRLRYSGRDLNRFNAGPAFPRFRDLALGQLGRVSELLDDLHYSAQVVRLAQALFPAEAAVFDPAAAPWYDLLRRLLAQVELAGWFPVNWDELDGAWQAWLEEPAPNDCPLAYFLEHIPLDYLGLDPYDSLEDAHPLFYSLAALLNEDVPLDPALFRALTGFPLPDDILGRDRLALYHAVLAADYRAVPCPLNGMPAAARYVNQDTGCEILDVGFFQIFESGLDFPLWDDLAGVRAGWQRALPLHRQLTALGDWAGANPARLHQVLRLVLTAGGVDA